jgi:hypothetical protein
MLNFLGIGAQKAGTTWVYENLRKHPEVAFPAGKEVHFWPAPDSHNLNSHMGEDWYQAKFADSPNTTNGEITPAYGFLEIPTIKRIKEIYPELRLIYLVRNPLERAWSGAMMALKRSELKIGEASDQWFIDHFRSQGSLRRGDYQSCIHNWQSVFGKRALLILKYEDIAINPHTVLEGISNHIGVDSGFFAALSADDLKGRYNEGSGEPLRSTLVPCLRALYRDKIASLRDTFGIDYGYAVER